MAADGSGYQWIHCSNPSDGVTLFPVFLLLRWRQTGETDQVIISHNVTNYEFFYEPFYVSKDNAPPHDERFVGYGFTRNTQVSDRRQVATNLLFDYKIRTAVLSGVRDDVGRLDVSRAEPHLHHPLGFAVETKAAVVEEEPNGDQSATVRHVHPSRVKGQVRTEEPRQVASQTGHQQPKTQQQTHSQLAATIRLI